MASTPEEIARSRRRSEWIYRAMLALQVILIAGDVVLGAVVGWNAGIFVAIVIELVTFVALVIMRRKIRRVWAETDRLIAATQVHLDAIDARLRAQNPHWRDGVEAPFGLRWNDTLPPPPELN